MILVSLQARSQVDVSSSLVREIEKKTRVTSVTVCPGRKTKFEKQVLQKMISFNSNNEAIGEH